MINKLLNYFEHRLNPYPDSSLPTSQGLGGFLWACTKGLRGWLVLFMVLTAGVGLFEALLYAWIGDVVDWLTVYRPEELMSLKGDELQMMLWVVLLSPIWVALTAMIHFQVIQGVFPMRMRWWFHKRMLGQSMQFYQDEFSGRVSAKVMQTALSVREVVMTLSNMMVYVGVYLVTSGVILGGLDVWLLIPFVLWIVMFGLTLWYFLPRLRQTASLQADARALMTGRVTDAYANIMTVKLFSHSRRELNYAKSAMHEFMGTVHAQMRWVARLELVNHVISMVVIGSAVSIGLYLWVQGDVGAGAIAVATAIALRLKGLTQWIMWETAMLFENIGTVQDGVKTLTTPQSIVDTDNASALTAVRGEIEFDGVNFAYEIKNKENGSIERQLLTNFDLHIKAGEKIGLVGRSGAGKSTLVNLLLRFYDVNGGKILIDNQDISRVTQESLRQNIGMVTQDTSLLHRTVRENIAYGRPNATDDEIIAAAKKAHAWDFIQTLKDKRGKTGLDAEVGERGVKLSGGQRQRIAIARVILKNAPILLLDEATSALDSEVEYAITQSLDEMMMGKTVIAIAHRLSTIASLDRLVVMDGGAIVEMGSHDELIAKNGIYAGLWARQSGGFLGEMSD